MLKATPTALLLRASGKSLSSLLHVFILTVHGTGHWAEIASRQRSRSTLRKVALCTTCTQEPYRTHRVTKKIRHECHRRKPARVFHPLRFSICARSHGPFFASIPERWHEQANHRPANGPAGVLVVSPAWYHNLRKWTIPAAAGGLSCHHDTSTGATRLPTLARVLGVPQEMRRA